MYLLLSDRSSRLKVSDYRVLVRGCLDGISTIAVRIRIFRNDLKDLRIP
ncbi:Uncharacterized protein ChrSV_4386 [Chromobacterium vaccinii]|nr:Uncharacterized protein ChrSW_4386 [Chromobacterium vaccinii]QND91842.1 Uncharacterized protein ChrSV_4386 [Chromobacterium vaccinii]